MEGTFMKAKMGRSTMKQLNLITEQDIRDIISDAVQDSFSKLSSPKPHHEEYLTRVEAAELLKVSVGSIDVWRRKGVIKAHRINSRIRFKQAELLNAIK